MEKKRILLVDDEPSLTRMMRLNLEATGKYEVCEENRGAEALDTARAFKPHLIFLDVMMPDMGGDEVAGQLKEDAVLKDIKFVFLTAIVTKDETGEGGGDISGHTFLAKPVKADELIGCIEQFLGK
jgi:CheY-like chemotaxis protein